VLEQETQTEIYSYNFSRKFSAVRLFKGTSNDVSSMMFSSLLL